MSHWVIVRIWLPHKEDKFVTAHEAVRDGDVGHVSIQTPDEYASFWPLWQSKKTGTALAALFGDATGYTVSNYAEDLQAKDNVSPDVEVVLYSLDVAAMNKKFREFKISSISGNWSLAGANIFNIFRGGGGQSCSGLAYDLLNVGGIQKLATWDFVAKTWVVSPDA